MEKINKELRIKYDNWISTLSQLELNHLELLYMKEEKMRGINYKEFDIWLFNKWSDKNGV